MNATTMNRYARELSTDELALVSGGLMPVVIDEMSVHFGVSDTAHVPDAVKQYLGGH